MRRFARRCVDAATDADALRAVLDAADQVIVPIEPEPLCFDASARTITKVIQPRNLPYTVVINNWDPRDGRHDLDETKEFVKANRWPLAKTVVRHYKLHARASADGQVVTEYPRDEMTLPAQEDFYQLALELNRLGGEAATKKPATAWISSEVYSRLLEFSDQEKRTQLRAARPFGVIAMDAIENHADQLGSMWKRSEARSPASGKLFARESGSHYRRHAQPLRCITLQGVSADNSRLLKRLAKAWGAGSVSDLVEQALRLEFRVR